MGRSGFCFHSLWRESGEIDLRWIWHGGRLHEHHSFTVSRFDRARAPNRILCVDCRARQCECEAIQHLRRSVGFEQLADCFGRKPFPAGGRFGRFGLRFDCGGRLVDSHACFGPCCADPLGFCRSGRDFPRERGFGWWLGSGWHSIRIWRTWRWTWWSRLVREICNQLDRSSLWFAVCSDISWKPRRPSQRCQRQQRRLWRWSH